MVHQCSLRKELKMMFLFDFESTNYSFEKNVKFLKSSYEFQLKLG